MTRSEAMSIITKNLEAADDQLLETVAAHLSGKPLPTMTVGEALETFPTDSVLPRPLTATELELIEQSKADFREGRTLTSEQMWSSLDSHLAPRGVARSTA